MLNELYELSNALMHHGLLQPTTNPNVSNVGKGDCLLIKLDKQGVPRIARLLQKEETSRLWKHSKGNHNSFPAIRVQKPLLAASVSAKIDDSAWKKMKLTEKINILRTLDYEVVNPECRDIKITVWSLEEFRVVQKSTLLAVAALRQLLCVFPDVSKYADFNVLLAKSLCQHIDTFNNEAGVDFVKKLLVGTLNEQTGKYVVSCMTYYDVYEEDGFPNMVGSDSTREALIDLLNSENENGPRPVHDTIVSSLSGKPGEALRDKYPNPNLPLLGLTYLYSKKSDTPCLTRYRMSGIDAFDANKSEVIAINDAIAFLTDKSRENKSWKAISDCNGDRPNLLLAYLADDPQNDALLAQILGDPSDFESEDEYKEEFEFAFDALCQQVLGTMEDLLYRNPLSKINLIILETLDPGRKQVTYENSLTAEQFRINLLRWSAAAKNQPKITIRVKDRKKIIEYNAVCPGPNDMCQLLKTNYTRSGMSKPMKQSAVSLQEIYRLYMPSACCVLHDDDFIDDVLQRVISRCIYFLGDIGQQLVLGYALPSTKQSRSRANHAVSFIALISILLWRLGVRKENYMLEVPFNVGQFLQLADKLHKEYCVQVRNSGDRKASLPTQLIGNEMLAIASENPTEALNRLRDRMRIYLAWANTATGDDSGLAKWILVRFGEVSARISFGDLPETFGAIEQAQVLLGYLASIPYERNENKEDKTNE